MIEKKYYSYLGPPVSDGEQTAITGLLQFIRSITTERQQIIKIHLAVRPRTGCTLFERQTEFITLLTDILGDRLPAVTFAVQPPADGHSLCAELWCVPDRSLCTFFRWNRLPHVLIETPASSELWSSGFSAEYEYPIPADLPAVHSVQQAAESCFAQITGLLEYAGFSYDDIFRQWNYIGHILDTRSAAGKTFQNYQIFNDIRSIYYQKKKDKTQYPAATGIGMDYPGICIDLTGIKNTGASPAGNIPLKSQVQKDAYRYAQDYLVGDTLLESEIPNPERPTSLPCGSAPDMPHKQTPLFERGRCILSDEPDGLPAIAMVSGTASIKGEETIDRDNILKQTENTLTFIDDLTRQAGLPGERHYTRTRMYVKPGVDAQAAIRLFRAHYPPPCSCTVVEADICRRDLLVEIEADLSYRKSVPDSSDRNA